MVRVRFRVVVVVVGVTHQSLDPLQISWLRKEQLIILPRETRRRRILEIKMR